jgi:hypothetical protein
MQCLLCQKVTHNSKFCSHSCSASFYNKIRCNDTEYKTKLSTILKNSPNVKRAIVETRYCLCGNSFKCKSYKKKNFCSQTCINKYITKPKSPGGYRPGSGRSKSGYYKGIYCGSTYELCWVIYNLDHNISFNRFDGYLTDGKLKYFPDFILSDNTIIEIKGYHTKDVDNKTCLAISLGYQIKVLYKKDLEDMFNYVKKQYRTNKFYELYDDHKAILNAKCSYCGKLFFRVKIKHKTIFCSRSCCGKYRKETRAKGNRTHCLIIESDKS